MRAWRDGDRMRPVGAGRHEDAAGPLHRPQGAARAAPHAAGGGERADEIVWVAGVAVDERFARPPDDA